LICKQKTELAFHEDGLCPGEPFFIPSPDSKSEDDGVLLSIILDAKNMNTLLAVLDAKTLKVIGRAIVPKIIPHGLHVNFFGKDRRNSILDQ